MHTEFAFDLNFFAVYFDFCSCQIKVFAAKAAPTNCFINNKLFYGPKLISIPLIVF